MLKDWSIGSFLVYQWGSIISHPRQVNQRFYKKYTANHSCQGEPLGCGSMFPSLSGCYMIPIILFWTRHQPLQDNPCFAAAWVLFPYRSKWEEVTATCLQLQMQLQLHLEETKQESVCRLGVQRWTNNNRKRSLNHWSTTLACTLQLWNTWSQKWLHVHEFVQIIIINTMCTLS